MSPKKTSSLIDGRALKTTASEAKAAAIATLDVTMPPAQGETTATTQAELVPTATAAYPKTIPAAALSMFRVPDGWTLIKLDLVMTPSGPEILDWETLSDEGPVPKTHAVNMFKVNAAQLFLMSE